MLQVNIIKIKYMNSPYTRISEIREELRTVTNEQFTAEELAQYLRDRLEKTLKNGLELLPLLDSEIKLNY